ncbi:MAG: cytochrome c oxidase subunit 3 family protein [Thermodesulfobacteriota bacterium]
MSSESHQHESHKLDPATEYQSSKLGMWLFLGTEVLLFGGLFAAYALFRAKFPALFHESSEELNVTLGALNTVVLIFSSLTMALAVAAAKQGDKKKVLIFLGITIFCAFVFGVNKYFEYGAKFSHHIYPSTNLFFALYFMMTGLHMIHVFVGILLLGVIFVLTQRNAFSAEYNTPVELVGLYWHLVDLIWIYLFPLLYLIG